MKRITLLFLIFAVVTSAEGIQNQVSISASTTLGSIGDQIVLKIIVKTNSLPDSIKVTPALTKGEIISQSEIQKTEQNGERTFIQDFKIAFFETGNFDIDPFTVELIKNGQPIDSMKTNSIPITIKSVLVKEDTDIKPLKDLVGITGNPFHLLKYILFVIALVMLMFLIRLYIKKRRQTPVKKAIPFISDIDELDQKMRELIQLQLFEKGMAMEFFIRFSDIFRHFIDRKYGFKAEDFTTEEIMATYKEKENDLTLQNHLEFLLNTADLVKFAQFNPEPPVQQEVVNVSQDIISIYKKRTIEARQPHDSL